MTDYKPEDFQRAMAYFTAFDKNNVSLRPISDIIHEALRRCAYEPSIIQFKDTEIQALKDEMASIPKPLPPDWGKVDGVDFGDNAAEPMTHSNDVTEDTSLSEALAWLLNNYGDKSKLNKEIPND